MDSIKAENIDLKKALQGKGLANEFKAIESLKNENSSLKAEISRLEKSVEKQTIEGKSAMESENKIRNLQEQLKEKEKRIEELKDSSLTEVKIPKGPMSSLIDDLQAKINKMKITLNEKDQLIGELKTKLKQK
jgi:predicted RNase H-like nuclease (RuvC/YqgF family)